MYPELAPKVLVERVRRFTLPNERIVIATRHHLAMIVQPILICVAAVLVAIGVDVFSSPGSTGLRTVFWVIALGAFLYMSWFLAHWLGDFFIVTHKRVMHTTGIINKKVSTLPLGKVVDFTYDQDVLGRIFGYGRFNMESAGEHPLGKVSYVARPLRTYLEISNLLFGPGAPAGVAKPQDVNLVAVNLPDVDGDPVEVVFPAIDEDNVTEITTREGKRRRYFRIP
jgi:hypothetical protein